MDSALYGALLSSSFSLLALIVSRLKCVYRRDPDGTCNPACACSGQPLEHQEKDIEIRRVEIEGKEVAVLIKKTSHFVRKIMIDSRFRKSGTPGNFTYELNRAITLPSKCAGFITDIELVHSWYNVDDHNEFLYFLEGFGQ